MSKIKVMDEGLANKIAAGEVVEKTMNVVKELVENSIDAESDEITIKLIDSGVKEIEVSDNGVGMDESDAVLAFSRHATSKLKKLDDLFYIESLGFRGEALPSIAAVSNVRLKTSNGEIGTIVTINGGENMKVERGDLQKGTTITVTDLFYNTPVRLKYLKNLYMELANIIDYVNKMALSYPNIKFTLINNDKILLSTDGSGDLLKVIFEIYGAEVVKKMISISGENDDYYISGYISYPEVTKSNRGAITTLVNGRVIRNNELNKTILECYHTYIPKGKYPIIVMNIDVDPILVDINVHPTKMDIKFSKMDTLKELITKLIEEKLTELTLIPNAATRNLTSVNEISRQINIDREVISSERPKYEEVVLNFNVNEDKTIYDDNKNLNKENTNKKDLDKEDLEETKKSEYRIKKMTPIGVVFLTYIIAENEDGIYLVDQHAAAERINFEKVLKSLKEEAILIDLLIPIKIELPANEFIIVKNNFDLLRKYGFSIEEFGFNSVIVRTYPNWIKEGYEESCIRSLIDIVAEQEKINLDQFIWRLAATTACRMSVMANTYISEEEQVWILDNIRKCENPFTCPHGRPTIITYTKYELDKMFKRTKD